MKTMRFLLGLFAVLTLAPLQATVLSDEHTGAQVTVPNDWKTTSTPATAKGFTAHGSDPGNTYALTFTVDDAVTAGPITESSRFTQDFLRSTQPAGATITSRGPRTQGGANFVVLVLSTKAPAPANSMTVWVTSVDGHGCGIALGVKGPDADKNATLNEVPKSFAVLTADERLDEKLRDNPFTFYGKVIDENGRPLAGATAKILVQKELGKPQDSTEHDVSSDSDGLFQLADVHSLGVAVTVMKDGYVAPSGGHEVRWSWLTGDPATSSMPTKDAPGVFLLQSHDQESQ